MNPHEEYLGQFRDCPVCRQHTVVVVGYRVPTIPDLRPSFDENPTFDPPAYTQGAWCSNPRCGERLRLCVKEGQETMQWMQWGPTP